MTIGMINTNETNEDTNQDSVKISEAPEAQQTDSSDLEHGGHWFHSLNIAEKRFHILFYFLAGLTGILVVQVIWQVAVLTAQ